MKVHNVKVGKLLDPPSANISAISTKAGHLPNNCCYMWPGRENSAICIYSGHNTADRQSSCFTGTGSDEHTLKTSSTL